MSTKVNDLLSALLGMEDNSSGGGVISSSPVDFLLNLTEAEYNALSKMLHACGMCGGLAGEQSSVTALRAAPPPFKRRLKSAAAGTGVSDCD